MKKRIATMLILVVLLIACEDDRYSSGPNFNMDASYAMNGGEEAAEEKYTDYGENKFVKTSEEAKSTFGIDADGGSYANTRRYLNLGSLPPTAAVRTEEFINYFTFDDPEPTSENVSIHTEATDCPWYPGHYLLRIGLKGKTLSQSETGPSNLVFLIDVSGSMSSPDKLELLKKGFEMLVDELDGTDRIAIVTYAGADKVVLESTYCDEKNKIKRALRDLDSGGSTAGAKGIITAYEIAKKNFIPGGNNRVIVGSDGDFNVGPSSTEELVKLIEEKRKSGIYLTVLGVGQGNLNDAMMEQLANNGNGNYEYIDNLEQLKKVFVYEKQKFYTVAEDCKIQLTFNEKSVDAYRLIGYENRVLENEEFENDTVDAGEIGASQSITAFYEIIPTENPEGPFCELEFRYKKPGTKNSILLNHDAVDQAISFESASENMRFATAVAGFGLLMKKSEYKGSLTFDDVMDWGQGAVGADEHGFRSEFLELVETAQSIQ
ncbi:MAG: VWA domain-containing protein [Prolixibacteraceae bacterium]|nr:VWA domain-containing protein [Prolixibacteraceae bacterium]